MNFIKRITGLIVTVLSIGSILIVWFFRQEILDWWQLRDYNPPQSVVELASSNTMTDYGRKIFYVNKPTISEATEFNAECSRETSIVLGCYVPHKGIFLFNVTDPRLKGVKEVTAGHEMLHAAYDRLSNKDRQNVDRMTAQAFAKVTNERIKNLVDQYKKQDSRVIPNELHSILATEVKELPPELETYYKQYFINRSAIVAFSDLYEAEFSSRRDRVAELDKQLEQLKIEIEANKNELDIQYNALSSQKKKLNNLLNSGDVTAYNLGVPVFNEQVNQYNASVADANKLINNHDSIVEKRNALAIEVQDLAKSIDSRPQNF